MLCDMCSVWFLFPPRLHAPLYFSLSMPIECMCVFNVNFFFFFWTLHKALPLRPHDFLHCPQKDRCYHLFHHHHHSSLPSLSSGTPTPMVLFHSSNLSMSPHVGLFDLRQRNAGAHIWSDYEEVYDHIKHIKGKREKGTNVRFGGNEWGWNIMGSV